MELNHDFYMKKALQLARKGLGKTSPNPMVGAVIVKDGNIIGQGYHQKYGGPHAEVEAVRNAQEAIEGATLYVTLEPCCHYRKKTPPCLDMLLQYNLKRVVIGALDPNPAVNGRSVNVLRQRGIDVEVGILGEECEKLNEVFFKWVKTGLPFVTLKLAQTLDGRIAAASGDSRWISSESSLKFAHKLRRTHDAVLIGAGTAVSDNPQLTVRRVRGRNPCRIVVDSSANVPLNLKVFSDNDRATTILATTRRADPHKCTLLKDRGVNVLVLDEDEKGTVQLTHLLKELGNRNISSVLVEGGSSLATSFIRNNLVDKFIIILAPKIMGKGIESVGDLNISKAAEALKLSFLKIYRSGQDVIIEAKRDI